jgi:hypothetical protein
MNENIKKIDELRVPAETSIAEIAIVIKMSDMS